MPKRVLVVEDDPDFGDLIRIHLEANDYDVVLLDDGLSGLQTARAQSFDLAILDLSLPRLDGREVCRALRADSRYLPIIMLTARTGESDRVLGLEIGADDYLTKPCSMSELVARIGAIFRRIQYLSASDPEQPCAKTTIRRGNVHIDVLKRQVRLGGSEVHLTAREFDLLHQLASNPGRVYSRKQLLDEVWGLDRDAYEHTVNAHINRLRGKIERKPTKPETILTVWGGGYKFRDH